MFKLFKNPSETVTNPESQPKKESIQESVPEPERKTDSEAEKNAIANVLEYYNNLQAIGGNFDVAQIEQIAGMPLEEFIEALEKNPVEMKFSSADLVGSLKNIMSQSESPSILKWFRKFNSSVTAKATFVALMLFLTFAPDLQAMEKGDEVKDKTEDKTELLKENQEVDDGKTYEAKAADFEGDKLDLEMNYDDFERYSKLDLSNYFDTDKADISPDDLNDISDNFSKFLDTINSDNYEQVKATVFKLLVSCDYRSTKNWEDGNEGLAKARLQALETALQEILDNFDFSGSGLSEEEIKDIKTKGFVLEMPDNGIEKGVTLISDLINPDTGENYTDKEIEDIKNNDAEKYENLLAQCRYVKAEFLSPKPADNLEKIPPLKAEFQLDSPEMETKERTMPPFNDFDKVVGGVDNSGSMNAHQAINNLVKGQESLDTDLSVRTFSDELDKGETELSSLEELTDFVKNIEKTGNSNERAVHSALEILENLEEPADNEKTLVFMLTDEAIRVDWETIVKAKAEAELKNATLMFIIAHERGSGTQEIMSLEDLEKAYLNHHWEEMNKVAEGIINTQEAKISSLGKGVSRLNQQIDFNIQRLDRNLDEKDKRAVQERINERNNKLKDYQSQIEQAQELANAFKLAQDEGDPIKLIQALQDSGRSIGTRLSVIGGGGQFATVE